MRSIYQKKSIGIVCILTVMFLACAWTIVELYAADKKQVKLIESPITEDDRDHWAFMPLKRPDLPKIKNKQWPRNAIDYFILDKMKEEELTPSSEADRLTLLRRVTFDLTGLPPTAKEIKEYLNDKSPKAYAHVVKRLLASTAYGERFAQFWLDLARFAETDGFEHDKLRKKAWKYRDWVISSLNKDMPYDQFLAMQLAGDELQPNDPDAAVATMFCLSGPDMPDINSQEERRNSLLNEMTSTVGSVFLGLQMECASCHDHKFDPISQADFYRLRSFFEPAVHVKRDKSVSVLNEKKTEGKVPASYISLRGDWKKKGAQVHPTFLRIANPKNKPVKIIKPKLTSGRRTALAKWMTNPKHPLTSRVIVNRLWQFHFGEGLCNSPSDFGVIGDEPIHTDLVDYLATELIRNKWSMKKMHHLMVSSATYRQASRPPAGESKANTAKLAKWKKDMTSDPANLYWARGIRRRLEGEAIRDAMLMAAGRLNRKQGGPGVHAPLPKEVRITLLKKHQKVSKNKEDHFRRSIYIFARRNLRYPIFDIFDRPDAGASCAKRNQSIIAPQSLYLLNSELTLASAQRLAGLALKKAKGNVEKQIDLIYRHALSRPATSDEQAALQTFLKQQRKRLVDEKRTVNSLALPTPLPEKYDPYAAAALTDLSLAVFNLSEFIYID